MVERFKVYLTQGGNQAQSWFSVQRVDNIFVIALSTFLLDGYHQIFQEAPPN